MIFAKIWKSNKNAPSNIVPKRKWCSPWLSKYKTKTIDFEFFKKMAFLSCHQNSCLWSILIRLNRHTQTVSSNFFHWMRDWNHVFMGRRPTKADTLTTAVAQYTSNSPVYVKYIYSDGKRQWHGIWYKAISPMGFMTHLCVHRKWNTELLRRFSIVDVV